VLLVQECSNKCEWIEGRFVANDELALLTIDGKTYSFNVVKIIPELDIVEVETSELKGYFKVQMYEVILFTRPMGNINHGVTQVRFVIQNI
jgi:hypothetical protein